MSDLKAGTLLLAEPYLLDPNFRRAAIALVDHHDEGTVGFVINHPLDWRVTDVMDGFPDFAGFLGYGGPVQRDTLHFLHTLGERLGPSEHVGDGVYWGGDFEVLTGMIRDGIADERHVRFFLGYSGWDAGQLAGELADNTWVTAALTADLLFDVPADQTWSRAMDRLGDAYGVIGRMDEESLN